MNTKKVMTVLLALVMVLSLVACTGEKAPGNTEAPQQSNSAAGVKDSVVIAGDA